MTEFAEFPKMVYGPDGSHAIINSEDERPDGYVDTPGGPSAEADAALAAAKDDAEAKEKALRRQYREFLDAHNVKYAKNLSTPKLADLVSQLEAHLAAQASAAKSVIESGNDDSE